jgi:hypothetical protein
MRVEKEAREQADDNLESKKANKIITPHIDWHWSDISSYSPLSVPAGRTLVFNTTKTPTLNGVEDSEFIALDSENAHVFGYYEDLN